ncbi:hypothetical protein K469DRAFT_348383 [Zopfia rhizophila CBS 207.26]|uniref:Uncharacterized protein n=1 Tax=Zopfia rhizophila CBS 207.26 TaxID=1314779 RepID=A0A6A6DGK9_9PEZI|nr:hypothetical protein K469DRAFT_348383 [Zopfia rhizophila CBS 207.26]
MNKLREVSDSWTQPARSRIAPGRSRGRLLWTAASLLIGFLWIAPNLALLILNFEHHIIGPSVWCPFGRCQADNPFSYDNPRGRKLDEYDHNALGALQFVAKALEIWFGFIAGSLVYGIARIIASWPDGLPLGFMLAHLEYGDPLTYLDKIPWVTPKSIGSAATNRTWTLTLYLFMLFTAFMCLVYNLMGPAVAVLVLPTLQWIDTPRLGQQFGKLDLAVAPTTNILSVPAGALSQGCSNTTLAVGNYSCTSDIYAPILDGIANDVVAIQTQDNLPNVDLTPTDFVITYESGLNFGFNYSSYDVSSFEGSVYTPSRQTLRGLALDQMNLGNAAEGASVEKGFQVYNKSLQSTLKRDGPIIHALPRHHVSHVLVTDIGGSPESQIRCYDNWMPTITSTEEVFWECIRTGPLWGPNNVHSKFSINGSQALQRYGYADELFQVNVFFSDKAFIFNISNTNQNGISGGLPDCMYNATSSCDWDVDFAGRVSNDSSFDNLLTLEISNPAFSEVYVSEFSIFSGLAMYTLETADPIAYVKTTYHSTDIPVTPLVVHPDWILAAWSVDRDGVVPDTRAAASHLAENIVKAQVYEYKGLDYDWRIHFLLCQSSFLQGMSLVSWTNTTDFVNPSTLKNTEDHPILMRYGSIHAWAYGLTGRTSKLGVAVVIVGIVCVFFRTGICIITGTHERSGLELLSVALRRTYEDDLDGLDETDLAKVRYQHIRADDGGLTLRRSMHYKALDSGTNLLDLSHRPNDDDVQ